MFNIALFGAGRIGHVHAININGNVKTNLYSVVDPYVEGANKLAKQYSAKIQTVDEAMTDPNVHGVCIGSITDTHANFIELAAKNGKIIFCEKPIDLDLKRVSECLKVLKEHKVPMLVGFNRRFDPQFSQLKARFEKGVIGKAESLVITSRDPSAPPAEYTKTSGGLFRDMTIHDLDMARFIIGENPVTITAHGSCLVDKAIQEAGDIDTATLVMTFPSGAIATIINSRRSGYGYDQRIELHGEKGLLRAENEKENLVDFWGEHGCTSANPQPFFLERYEAAYAAEWAHFVEILEGKAVPNCDGTDGEYALILAEAALESMNSGTVVTL